MASSMILALECACVCAKDRSVGSWGVDGYPLALSKAAATQRKAAATQQRSSLFAWTDPLRQARTRNSQGRGN